MESIRPSTRGITLASILGPTFTRIIEMMLYTLNGTSQFKGLSPKNRASLVFFPLGFLLYNFLLYRILSNLGYTFSYFCNSALIYHWWWILSLVGFILSYLITSIVQTVYLGYFLDFLFFPITYYLLPTEFVEFLYKEQS